MVNLLVVKFSADLAKFTGEILNGKLRFLCSDVTRLFQNLLKASENRRFSCVFRTYRKRPAAWNKQGEIQICFQFSAALTNFLPYVWFESIKFEEAVPRYWSETRENILRFQAYGKIFYKQKWPNIYNLGIKFETMTDKIISMSKCFESP